VGVYHLIGGGFIGVLLGLLALAAGILLLLQFLRR
jgi:ABC-type Co2+ transport system permease subunit